MNRRIENDGTISNGNSGYMTGFIAGSIIGAGLAILFAPRVASSELRERLRESASHLKDAAVEGYQSVTARVVGVVDGVTDKGQAMRDDVADAVGRGAREVEQFAMAAKKRS